MLCLEEILNVFRISHVGLSNFLQPDVYVSGVRPNITTFLDEGAREGERNFGLSDRLLGDFLLEIDIPAAEILAIG